MRFNWNKLPTHPRFLNGQPVLRLLMAGFLIITLLPVSVLGVHIYHAAWENAWREIKEKHQLLAENMAAPIEIYVDNHKQFLGQLARAIPDMLASQKRARQHLQQRFATSIHELDGFNALIYLDLQGQQVAAAHRQAIATGDTSFVQETCFLRTRNSGAMALSGIKASPITGEPVFVLSHPVVNSQGNLQGVMLAELRVDLIESLRKKIHFGKKGHSAIIDQFGKVIAHPNPAWMREMKDLSHLNIVQRMMNGRVGVMEFYSPFIKENMVAGYAHVPSIGWGIMVPQPKSEVSAQVNALIYSHVAWLGAGMLLAFIVGLALARWITRPINRLADAAESAMDEEFGGHLQRLPNHGPREVQLLKFTLQNLFTRLLDSKQQVHELNHSLQRRVEDATRQLLDANRKLEHLSNVDHLTNLLNRRYFEAELSHRLGRRASDREGLSIILIDIDHFKSINDRYGHAAGDAVLVEVARVLSESMRPGDIVARYGGDEFVAQLSCEPSVGNQRAHEIRERVHELSFHWRDRTIQVTVSVGVLHCAPDPHLKTHEIMHQVDTAMYQAKQSGRNRVVELM